MGERKVVDDGGDWIEQADVVAVDDS